MDGGLEGGRALAGSSPTHPALEPEFGGEAGAQWEKSGPVDRGVGAQHGFQGISIHEVLPGQHSIEKHFSDERQAAA